MFHFYFFLVSLVLIVYYSTEKGQSLLRRLIPYGKMSLTNYITQSLLGGAIFYSWGLGLSVSITMSFLIGVGIFIVQYIFSCWWMKKTTSMDLSNIYGKRQHGLAQRKIKPFVLILKNKTSKAQFLPLRFILDLYHIF